MSPKPILKPRRKVSQAKPRPVLTVGRRKDIGEWLHTVDYHSCPVCPAGGAMEVYEKAVKWVPCGHTYDLPPLSKVRAA